MLEARPARDHHVGLGSCPRHECVEHRGLPDASFPGEEHELPLAGPGALQPSFELRQQASAPDRFGRRVRSRGDRRHPSAGGNETVSTAWHRLDEAGGPRVVAQGPADLEDAHLEHAVGGVGFRPPGVEQLCLRDELSVVLHQAAQDRERLRGERDHLTVANELLVGEVQGETLERQASICVHRRAGEPLPHRLLTVI